MNLTQTLQGHSQLSFHQMRSKMLPKESVKPSPEMGRQLMKHLVGCLKWLYKNRVGAEITEEYPEN